MFGAVLFSGSILMLAGSILLIANRENPAEELTERIEANERKKQAEILTPFRNADKNMFGTTDLVGTFLTREEKKELKKKRKEAKKNEKSF